MGKYQVKMSRKRWAIVLVYAIILNMLPVQATPLRAATPVSEGAEDGTVLPLSSD